ncbi:MAG: YtxH domain-containing protein [Buchananella hordeovulneris]|nr:YtxH domain-containing protein [Buchananella hordeovulneris]
MGKKFSLLLGLGLGYVLGTRAGRAQYERMKTVASNFLDTPMVRSTVDKASAKVTEVTRKVGTDVTDRVAGMVKDRMFGAQDAQGQSGTEPQAS